MPVLSYVYQLFNVDQCRPTSIRSGGKTGRCNVRAARATTLAAGARTSIRIPLI